jgi:hypothetical protein
MADLGPHGWCSIHTQILWGWIHRYGTSTVASPYAPAGVSNLAIGLGKSSFALIPGIKRDLRNQLTARYTVEQGRLVSHSTSEDGTRKFLVQFAAGQEVESAYPASPPGSFAFSRTQLCFLFTHSRLHSGTNPRHVMRVFAGRLHAFVQLLPHRNTTRGTTRTRTLAHAHARTEHAAGSQLKPFFCPRSCET